MTKKNKEKTLESFSPQTEFLRQGVKPVALGGKGRRHRDKGTRGQVYRGALRLRQGAETKPEAES